MYKEIEIIEDSIKLIDRLRRQINEECKLRPCLNVDFNGMSVLSGARVNLKHRLEIWNWNNTLNGRAFHK